MGNKLRLLLLNSARVWGGVEKWMLEVGSGLMERGHLVLAGGWPGSLWLQIAADRGIRTVPLKIRSDVDPLMSLRLFWIIRREKINIICTNSDKELRLAGPGAKMMGVAVVSRKGLPAVKNRLRYRLVYRLLVDRIVTPAHSIKQEFTKYRWLNQDLVAVIHNGVEVDCHFPPGGRKKLKEELGLNSADPVVGIIGNMRTLSKGHEVLIRAAKKVVWEFPGVKFLVVGDGEMVPFFQGMVKDLGLTENFVFTGFRTDGPCTLQVVDIFTLPSFCEGLPNAILEAMAAAKPVIATPVGEIPEVIEDKKTGLLIPPGDADALADALTGLLRSPERARRMGEAAQRQLRDNFSRQKMIEEVERLFQEVLASK